MSNESLTLTIAEVARLVGCSRQHLHNLWRAGKGPRRFKAGPRKVLILKSDLLDWLRGSTGGAA